MRSSLRLILFGSTSSASGGAAGDSTPDSFSFSDVTGATLSTQYESNAITVSGIDIPATMTITGGEYQINGGAWASSSTTVVNGNSVKVRGTSSGSPSTAVNVALTIGGVSDTYTITTAASSGPAAGTLLWTVPLITQAA